MKNIDERITISDRTFIGLIRSALDKAGAAEVRVGRQWIDKETPGYPLLLHVPVAAWLRVPLQPRDSFFEAETVEDLTDHAEEFARALINLQQSEPMLRQYAEEVREAAAAQVADARQSGLDILLEGVGFRPTYAFHLTNKDFRQAASHVLASVQVRRTSFHLRPELSQFVVEEVADVASEMVTVREEQRLRQSRITELDALGGDLVVDTLTLELLSLHGLEPSEVLSDVWRNQCVNMTVQHRGRAVPLSLVSSDGIVTATIMLEDAGWNGQFLWFRDPAAASGNCGLAGGSLSGLVQHPVFASRSVVEVLPGRVDRVVLDTSEKAIFDGDARTIKRIETLYV